MFYGAFKIQDKIEISKKLLPTFNQCLKLRNQNIENGLRKLRALRSDMNASTNLIRSVNCLILLVVFAVCGFALSC
jgi:hypothetical protein